MSQKIMLSFSSWFMSQASVFIINLNTPFAHLFHIILNIFTANMSSMFIKWYAFKCLLVTIAIFNLTSIKSRFFIHLYPYMFHITGCKLRFITQVLHWQFARYQHVIGGCIGWSMWIWVIVPGSCNIKWQSFPAGSNGGFMSCKLSAP